METIEIGAFLVETHSLETVGELGTFVKPVRHPVLTPFCTELTTIRQSDVDIVSRSAPRLNVSSSRDLG
jgi:inhibitor of KinA sporulation pathway (predicted exonuclease)